MTDELRAQRLEYQRRYDAENRERIKEYQRKYRLENKQKKREWAEQYYLENRDRMNEYGRKYSHENLDKKRARYHKDGDASREYQREYRLARNKAKVSSENADT